MRKHRLLKQGLAFLLSFSMILGPCAPGSVSVFADTGDGVTAAEAASETEATASDAEHTASPSDAGLYDEDGFLLDGPVAAEELLPAEEVLPAEEMLLEGAILEAPSKDHVLGEDSGWIEDYAWGIYDETEKIVIIEDYEGTGTDLTVRGTVTVDGEEYRVKLLTAGVWYNHEQSEPLTSITFTDGVLPPDADSGSLSFLFGGFSSLESVDLSGMDAEMITSLSGMFDGCDALGKIVVPAHLPQDVENVALPAAFYDEELNEYEELPVGLEKSLVLLRNPEQRRLVIEPEAPVTSPGGTVQLTARLVPQEDSAVAEPWVRWSCDDKQVAMVSESGVVKAFAEGVTTVTAVMEDENLSASCTLRVAWGDEDTTWQEDYAYTTQNLAGTITLRKYVGEGGDVFLPDEAKIDGRIYKTKLASAVYEGNESITSFCTGSGVILTDLTNMFADCGNMQSIEISNWDTSGVRSMKGMFKECGRENSNGCMLDVASLDTSSVTDMSYMFSNSRVRFSPSIGTMDTSSVTNMKGMFSGAGTEDLDLGTLDVSKVTDMSEMFRNSGTRSIDLSGWNAESAVTMRSMFELGNAEKVKMDGFSAPEATDLGRMFWGNHLLEQISLNDFYAPKAEDLEGFFLNCSVQELDLSSFEVPAAKNVSLMFEGCDKLRELKLGSTGLGQPEITNRMFWNCDALTELDLTEFDMSRVSSAEYMFAYCSGLKTINFDPAQTPVLTSMECMFVDCPALRTLDLSTFRFSTRYDVALPESVFSGCHRLMEIYTPESQLVRGIALPYTMFDAAGNRYEELPVLSAGSFRISADYPEDMAGWQDDFDYTLDRTEKKILLSGYHGSGSEIKIPSSAYEEGDIYSTVIVSATLWENVRETLRSVEFSKNVTFTGNMSGLFQDCGALERVVFDDCSFNAFSGANMFSGQLGGTELVFRSCSFSGTDLSGLAESTEGLVSVRFESCEDFGKMNGMFRGCGDLVTAEYLDCVFSDDRAVMNDLFRECTSLETVKIACRSMTVMDVSGAMAYCSALSSVTMQNVSGIDPFEVQPFQNDWNLTDILILKDYAYDNTEYASVLLPYRNYHSILEDGTDTGERCGEISRFDFTRLQLKVPETERFSPDTETAEMDIGESVFVHFGGIRWLSELAPRVKSSDYSVADAFLSNDGWDSEMQDHECVEITGEGPGEAVITVETEDGQFHVEIAVTVHNEYAVPVESVSVRADDGGRFNVGDTRQLYAEISPWDATNHNVTWSSSDPSVASVDENGKVTALKGGSAVITATTVDGGYTAEYNANIYSPATGVHLNRTEASMTVGESLALMAILEPEDASDQELYWSSSDENVLQCEWGSAKECSVRAVGPGTAVITVTVPEGGFTAQCTITVEIPYIPVQRVWVSPSELSMTAGEEYTLEVSVEPVDATNPSVSWTSSDDNIASVDGSGKVTAHNAGTVQISAVSVDGGFYDVCTVHISLPRVTGITLDTNWLELAPGGTWTLSAIVEPDNAEDKSVRWESNDESVVTVDQEGKVTALRPGNAAVAAVTNDGGYSASCSIYVTGKNVTGVRLVPESLEILTGETGKLTAVLEPEDAAVQTVLWSSSDENVAAVDENGNVTTVSEGSAVITVKTVDGGYEASCEVTVLPHATGIHLDKEHCSLTEGESCTLTAYVEPENAGSRNVIWSSSDEGTAAVDENGTVTAISEGSAVITVTTEDGGYTASCEITVKRQVISVTGVTLDHNTLTLTEGDTFWLIASVTPEDADNQSVIWSSSDEGTAAVDEDGAVTAVSEGSAVITVTTEDGGYTASCEVTVERQVISVTGVTLDQSALTLTEGETFRLTASVTPENADNRSVIWSSSDEGIAAVDQNGNVTAVCTGTAVITVMTEDGGLSASCEVLVQTCQNPVSYIYLNVTYMNLWDGDSVQLIANVEPPDAPVQGLVWSSSNESVAVVDEQGYVTAVSMGSAVITVTETGSGISAQCTIDGMGPGVIPVSGIRISQPSMDITMDEAGDAGVQLYAWIEPESASNRQIIWTSSDPGVAYVTLDEAAGGNYGTAVIHAVAPGRTVITATADDGGYAVECMVTVTRSDAVEAFVKRLYRTCLGREADRGGLDYWCGMIRNGQKKGIRLAGEFVFSKEFSSKNYCDEHFVEQLYPALMGRKADSGGLAYWVGNLEKGVTREAMVNDFTSSNEYKKLCSDAGIELGAKLKDTDFGAKEGIGTKPCGPCAVCGEETKVVQFAERMYTVCLGRAAEANGLAYWSKGLYEQTITGKSILNSFFLSSELKNKNLSSREYVTRIYKVMLNRSPDSGGLNYWMGRLDSGSSPTAVIDGFIDSQEFTKICTDYGIRRK